MSSILKNKDYLKIKSEDVIITDNVDKIISDLEISLKTSEISGVGLAAPQIGIYKNIAIVRYNNTLLNLINAKIISKKHPIVCKNEGCLSFPDLKIKSIRFNEIVLKNNNEMRTYVGEIAVIIEHELDHLDGLTIEERNLANINKNDACPCESGKKFKSCHMKEIK